MNQKLFEDTMNKIVRVSSNGQRTSLLHSIITRYEMDTAQQDEILRIISLTSVDTWTFQENNLSWTQIFEITDTWRDAWLKIIQQNALKYCGRNKELYAVQTLLS